MESNVLTAVFVAALLLSFVIKVWLSSRQMRHVAAHRGAVPVAFAGTVSLAAHQKAADYTLAKGRFGLITTAWGTAVLLGWTLLGGLSALNAALYEAVFPVLGAMGYQLALLAAFSLISTLLDLPFELYDTFRLEQRFGFNRMTWRLYLADAVKSLLVGVVIGLPIAALILWIMGATGSLWWLWAWGAWMGFNLLALVLYPTVIAPIFNKFEPLPDESLRERVQALMARCGFRAKGLFVMDGSKRSGHANAYFTGLGAAKRVVFFDTLLAKLTGGEVEAVLAHELGHYKHRHVLKRIVLMFALSLLGFALLGWLSGKLWFYAGLGTTVGMNAPNDALALLLFMLVVPVFGFFISPLMSLLSRRHEFEADAYASEQASGNDLAAALLKLHEDNAATLTPDPLYVRFWYSHPPASERIAALALQTGRP
ncbi:M48 family metallopeptidase [Rhizobacter sp. LjRoot28]|uniref:M48 family metallopeptidase n=1 Tax=Rhizobacter sp. LjRoot28 TaxID=3342309 RepID=UPI003ED00079